MVRTKAIPPPPADLDAVERVRAAVPLVPGSTEDCCTRIVDRVTDVVPGRDEANRWLAFLTAIDLVAEHDSGFARTRSDLAPDAVASRFQARVFGAREVLAILAAADTPLEPGAVFERFEPHVPPWERDRDPTGWRDRWEERVHRLLDWLVLLDLAETVDGRYRPTVGPEP